MQKIKNELIPNKTYIINKLKNKINTLKLKCVLYV